MIQVIALVAGAGFVGWYAWQGTRARDRWPALLSATEALAMAFLVAVIAGWSLVPWWVWWIVALPAIGSLTVVAWRWPELGTARPRWPWLSLMTNVVLMAGSVIVVTLPPG